MNDIIIGYDAKRIVRNSTGLGNYSRNLVNALSAIVPAGIQLRLYAPDEGSAELRSQVLLRPNVSFAFPRGIQYPFRGDLWRSRLVVGDMLRDGVQLYHGLSGRLPSGLKRAGISSVVTIHDLIFLRYPEYYHWLDAKIYKHQFYRTLQQADRVIAISECTKRDILHYSDFPASKIDVIYQSASTEFKMRCTPAHIAQVRQRYHLPHNYVLNVGTIEQRKNVLLAVKALKMLPADLHIVIVGKSTPYAAAVRRWAAAHGLDSRVHMLSHVPNSDLLAIYAQARCFVYPSRYEGFGIPIIEAIQSGLPVIGATGSCLEEAGGPSCIYVDPDDVPSMAQAIDSLLTDPDKTALSVAQAQEWVKRFENADVASQVLAVYRKLLH